MQKKDEGTTREERIEKWRREDENEEAIRTDEGKAGWRRNETVRTREQARGRGKGQKKRTNKEGGGEVEMQSQIHFMDRRRSICDQLGGTIHFQMVFCDVYITK